MSWNLPDGVTQDMIDAQYEPSEADLASMLGPEELEAEHETEHLGDIQGCPACLAERRRVGA